MCLFDPPERCFIVKGCLIPLRRNDVPIRNTCRHQIRPKEPCFIGLRKLILLPIQLPRSLYPGYIEGSDRINIVILYSIVRNSNTFSLLSDWYIITI
jgi:hypothetical protein